MIDALAIVAVLGLGAALGWWLEGRAASTRKVAFRLSLILLAAPVVVFVIANVLSSDTLAMLAGLSMMALLAVAVPVGIGVLIGGRLGRSRRSRNEPASQGTPEIPYIKDPPAPKQSPVPSPRLGVLLLAAGVGSGFWLALALGFRLHDQPIPVELDQGLLLAAVVFVISVSLGLRAIWRRRRRPAPKDVYQVMAERDAWVTTMKPKYDLDPRATACCEHLAPVESAMRAIGIQMRLEGPLMVSAKCRVDAEALKRRFVLPQSVAYQEWYSRDRSDLDPPQTLVYCEACPSKLWVLHASEGSLDTPTFPSGT
jgi:hypothetical protein